MTTRPGRIPGAGRPPRVTGYRYDLLGPRRTDSGDLLREALIGTLQGVTGGSIKYDGYGTVKAGGTLEVTDTGQEVDWLTSRVRPVVLLQMPEGATEEEVPLGVFLAAAPVEKWTATGRTWTVEIMDKLSILDQDIPDDADSEPVTFGLPQGTNVVDAVKALIESTGESAGAIAVDTKVLANPMSWPIGTTLLRIISDILTTAGFSALSTDSAGNFRARRYIEPEDRPIMYESEEDFGNVSVLDTEWTLDHDIYGIPNRVVAIGQGDAVTEAPVAVVTNTDPSSPFSYQARGRWITVVDTGVEAVDEASLLSYARRRMTFLSRPAMDFHVKHLFLPYLEVGSVVRFREGGIDVKAEVRTTQIPLDARALVTTTLRMIR